MAKLGGTLLAIASGAANVINQDAAADREFMRKQKVKLADSRLVRQEQEYDKKKAQWDQVQQYGTDKVGQYMQAFGMFKDHEQALSAVNDTEFSAKLKQMLTGIKDPGSFTPYDVGVVTDDEVRARYGDNSVAGKILGAFGVTKERRADVRKGKQTAVQMESEAVAQRARQAFGLGEFAPAVVSPPIQTQTTFSESTDSLGNPQDVTTTQLAPEGGEKSSFFTVPNTVKHERDGDQLITTVTSPAGELISTKATAIQNYRTISRPEVDIKTGIATWAETGSDGTVTPHAVKVENMPKEADKGFQINNATYNVKAGGYTVLEQDNETKELKTTFIAVDGVPKGLDQSTVRMMTFDSVDPTTGEQVKTYAAFELVGEGEDRRLQKIDAIKVKTATETSIAPKPADQFSSNRVFSKLVQAKASGEGDTGKALKEFSEDQLRAFSIDVADEAIRMSRDPKFQGMNFGDIERQATLRLLRAEALRQSLRAGKKPGE